MDARVKPGHDRRGIPGGVLKPSKRIGKALRTRQRRRQRAIRSPREGPKTVLMTSAIIFAFASAFFLGAGVVLAQKGLRTVEPLSGAAISVPTFTVVFLVLS